MLVLMLLPAPTDLNPEAWRLVALAAWMVIWWMSEAVPMAVTALLPIPMMPLLGIAGQKSVGASYGDPLIFLFLGGFLIAAAMQRWMLHKRIALRIVKIAGTRPQGIIAGFMLATALLSMWISNTATAVMMYAVAISMVEFVATRVNDLDKARRFGIALLLGVAYSASIGGVGTLIGTPPNVLLAGFLADTYGIHIDFSTWMLIGVPLVVLLLPLTWLLLCRVLFRVKDIDLGEAAGLIDKELQQLGPMSRGEQIVLVVFLCTAILWIFRSSLTALTGLAVTDTTIALLAAVLLFALPASIHEGQLTLDWQAAKLVPWGVLLLFGGGLALAGAFKSTGLAEAIGAAVAGLGSINVSLVALMTIIAIVALTELTSNTATTATFLPILGAVAVGMGKSPMVLAIPVALASSMAFMMPVATPPNAIVFSYEKLHISDMMKAGIWMNLISILLIYSAMQWLAPHVFGISF
ncbi:MAG: DASS family sodium-coupled anion symporter [Gammaproteobacteria bacterium]